MEERINDKINEIEKYLEELERDMPENLEEYLADSRRKAACERHAERIIESIVDLAFLFAKHKKFDAPREEEGIFLVLASKEIISDELAKNLKEAKGMRNILAHKYGEVNDAIVFHAVSEELRRDAEEFIEKISEQLT